MFLLGHWKNFEELENALSLDELLAVLNAYRKKTDREQRFTAAIQGIDLGDSDSAPADTPSFEDVWSKAAGVEHETEEEALAAIGIAYEEMN